MTPISPWLVSDNPNTTAWLMSCVEGAGASNLSTPVVHKSVAALRSVPDTGVVVFLDASNGGGNPESVVEEARRLLPGVPLIALVENAGTGTRLRQVGADEYLIPEETQSPLLMRAIRYACERRLDAGGSMPGEPDRFQRYLENAPDIIFVLEPHSHRVTYLNREELFGLSKEVLTQPGAIFELIHEADHAAVLQHWKTLTTTPTGDASVFEYRLQPRDGDWEWVQSRETVLPDDSGTGNPQILVSLSVITNRREREAAVRRYAERLQILHEIDQAIVSARSPQLIAQATLRHINRLVSCRRASVVIFNWEQNTFTIIAELPEGSMGSGDSSSLPLDWFWRLDELQQGELYRLEELSEVTQASQPKLLSWWYGQGVRTLVSIPLHAQRNLIGAINFGGEASDSFSAEDLVVMREVARVLAIGIGQARLYEQAHYHARKLEQRARRLLLVNDISLAVNRPIDLDAVLEAAARGLVQVIDLRQVGIVLLNERRDTWIELVSHSARRGGSSQALEIAVEDKERVQRLVQANGLLVADDLQRQVKLAGLQELLLEHPLDSLMVVPLQLGDEVIGIIGCDIGPGMRPFSREEADLVRTVANLLAVKIEHIRLLEAERNARNEAESHAASLRLRERHLMMLNSVTRATTGMQMEEMMQTVVDRLGESSGARGCYLTLWDETQQKAIPAAAYGPERDTYRSYQVQSDEMTLTGAVLQAGHPIQTSVNGESTFRSSRIASDFGPDVALAIPLLAGKERLGALIISRHDDHEFTGAEVTLYEQAAGQIALALSAARLFDETRRRAEELEVLSNLSAALRVADGAEEISTSLLTATVELFHADVVAILVPGEEPGTLVLAHSAGMPEDFQSFFYEIDGSIAGHVFTTGKPYRAENVLEDPLGHRPSQEAWRQRLTQAQSAIFAPLRAGTQVTGVVYAMTNASHALDEEDLGLLVAMAEITGSALHRAGLMETLEQRVEERTRELAQANVRLQELDRLKSKFVSDVSHELRTPITSISLYLDLIERGSPERTERYWAVLRKQTDRLNHLIEDILSLSRLQMGRVDVALAPTDLDELVEEVINVRSDDFTAAGLALEFTGSETLAPVLAQPDLLIQVVDNLLGNALIYTPRGGVRVQTYLDPERQMACLAIEDSGIGISEDDLPHVFERFYRGQYAGQSNIPGTGLGLTIVEEIVNLHHGQIEVHSETDKGTTFRVWIPVAAD